MSHPDYSQRVDHHQSLLIVVKPIGAQTDKKKFNKIYKKISRIQHVAIQDQQLPDNSREIWLRYKKSYPVESNSWGDFQSHRKVLGLITIGKCNCSSNLDTLWNCHNTIEEKYANTLFDSRCLLFGMSSLQLPQSLEQRISNHKEGVGPSTESCDISTEKAQRKAQCFLGSYANGALLFNSNPGTLSRSFHGAESRNFTSAGFVEDLKEKLRTKEKITYRERESRSCTPDSLDSEDIESAADEDKDIAECEKSNIKSSAIPKFILYNDFDKCGQLESDIRSFISSLFWSLETKRLDYLLDNHPFQVPNLISPADVEVAGPENRKLWMGRMKKHIADLTLQAGLPHEAFSIYTFAIELHKSAGDWLWLAGTYEGQCASSMVCLYPRQHYNHLGQKNSSCPSKYTTLSVPKGAAAQQLKSGSLPRNTQAPTVALGRGIFPPEKITDKFREAIVHYSKFRHAAVIEVECCIKAAKAHILQEKYLIASEFLQNIAFLNFPTTFSEQLQWWSILSDLYTEMNFHRKAAFYKYTAAACCVSLQNSTPDWEQCCQLLLQTHKGYKISFESHLQNGEKMGWPNLQIKILRKTVNAAIKIGNTPLAIRLLTFILTTFLNDLSENEKLEVFTDLGNLTASVKEVLPTNLLLSGKIMIPQFHLLNIPHIMSFRLQKPSDHHHPIKISAKVKAPQESSFICSPIQTRHKRSSRDSNKVDFKYVAGDVCEVMLEVYNPLPFELQVAHMELIADHPEFESYPTQLILAPNSGPHPVTLLGRPLMSGELKFLGYNTEIQGISSCCYLKDLTSIKRPFVSVDIIPSLPHLQINTTLPTFSTQIVHKDIGPILISGVTNLYCGESQECTVTFFNDGREKVELVNIEIFKGSKTVIITWNENELNSQIPIAPGGCANFKLNIHAVGNYSGSSDSVSKSGVLPQLDGGYIEAVCHSLNMKKSQFSSSRSPNYSDIANPMIVETYLQIRYTGGFGMLEEYCRQCTVVIIAELLPSLLITSWDVMPSEIPAICYLSLDIFNATNQEMELEYGDKKWIQIDAQNGCRVVVPAKRYSFNPLDFSNTPEHVASTCDPEKRKQMKLEEACKEHLRSFVDLKWSLPGISISGIASINQIGNWTPAKLDALIVSPLQWGVFINDEVPGTDDFIFCIGEVISVVVTLQNASDSTLHSLHLSINTYQDYQNGYRNYKLETKFTVVGSDQVAIDKIEPRTTYYHHCGLIFFNTGIYFLDIQCTSTEYSSDMESIKALLSSSKIAHSQPESQSRAIYTWRYTPSIEITLLED